MKEVKDKAPELFRHRLAEKHPGKTEKKIKTLSMKFSMLHEIIPSVTEYNDKGNLKYFSKLYVEVQPLIKHISDYIAENGYRGKDKRVDDLISKTREVEEYLKVLHLRYESLRLPPKSDHLRWWEYSQKGNKEILSEIKTHLEEMGTHLGEMKMILEEK